MNLLNAFHLLNQINEGGADYQKEYEEYIEAHKESDAENKYIDELLEKVGKNVEVDIPEEMVEEESDIE